MTSPMTVPATTDSSTLQAGCSAYDIHNHMYLPGYHAELVEE